MGVAAAGVRIAVVVGVRVGVRVGAMGIAVGDGTLVGVAVRGATVGSGAGWQATTVNARMHDVASTTVVSFRSVARIVGSNLNPKGGGHYSCARQRRLRDAIVV